MASATATVLLLLSACGGDDDTADSTTTTIAELAEATTLAPTTTAAAAAEVITSSSTSAAVSDVALVTEGATVVVANASGVNGGAGSLSDSFGAAGFTTVAATNSNESQLSTSKIYYVAGDDQARAVADSIKAALGGGAIEVLELPDPAPLTDPATLGGATVLVAMGNDVAGQSLEQLQSGAAADGSADDASSDPTESSVESSVETTDG